MSITIPASAIDTATTLVDGDARHFIVDAVDRDEDTIHATTHEFGTQRLTLFKFDADERVHVAGGD